MIHAPYPLVKMSENCGEANASIKFFDAIDTVDRYKLSTTIPNIIENSSFSKQDMNKEEGQKGKSMEASDIESFQFKQNQPLIKDWINEFNQKRQQNEKQETANNPSLWSREYSSFSNSISNIPMDSMKANFNTDFNSNSNFNNSANVSIESTSNQSTILNGWTKEFMEKYQEFEDDLDNIDSKINNITISDSSSWIQEYQTNQKSWAEEFKEQQESKELKETAKRMLSQINFEQDAKLKNSRFVAFLQKLTNQQGTEIEELNQANHSYNNSQFQNFHSQSQNSIKNWQDQYMENISPLITENDKEWLSMQKDWSKYKTLGYGYEGFIWEEYSIYNYSTSSPILNPYSSCTLNEADSIPLNRIKDAILAWESIVYRDPTNAYAWSKLGHLQQLNEMDGQAISAFIRVIQLQSQKNGIGDETLLALAASCANESCIADCIDALERYTGINQNGSHLNIDANIDSHLNTKINNEKRFNSDRIGNLVQRLKSKNDDMALSIAYNISGNYQSAIECLERLLSPFSSKNSNFECKENDQNSLSQEQEIIIKSRLGNKFLFNFHLNSFYSFLIQFLI